MLEWPPKHQKASLPKTVDVAFVPTKHVAWAILLAAFIVSAAIIGSGERDRRFRRSHPAVAVPSVPAIPPVADRSVAVLPFQNLTGDSQNSLYADGVREDLIAQLAKISELRVVDLDPRKERQASYSSSRELGRELGVAYFVRGTIQWTATRAKLRAKLIRAETDQTIWTETYEFEISDPFSLDPEVTQKIAEQLRKRIGSQDSFAALSPKA
jgi:TolB-like protein